MFKRLQPSWWALREIPAGITDKERREWEHWHSLCLTPRDRVKAMAFLLFLASPIAVMLAVIVLWAGLIPVGTALLLMMAVALVDTEPVRTPRNNPKPPWVKKPPYTRKPPP